MDLQTHTGGWQLRHDADATRRWRAAGVWRNRTTAEDARDLAADEPNRVCLIEGDVTLTCGRALRDAERLAAGLWALGLRPGDVLSFQLPNWHEALALNLAATLIGVAVNPIVSIYRDHEVATILADCGARAVVVPGMFRGFDHAAMMARLAPSLPDLRATLVLRTDPGTPLAPGQFRLEDLADGDAPPPPWPRVAPEAVKLVLYTSGTTGRPKGVLHSHETMARAFAVSFAHWGMAAGDTVLMPSPIGHVTGHSYGLEMPFNLRTRSVLMDRWDADAAVGLIERHGVSMMIGATPFLAELVDASERAGSGLASLRIFACGGAAVPPSLIRRANAVWPGCRSFRVFGASEAPMVTQGWLDGGTADLAADTDGAVVDFEVRLTDPDGEPAAPEAEGEVRVRGPALFLGYRDPDQTRDCFDADGFFLTGDLGRRVTGPDGVTQGLLITGRKKDLIIRGGENLSAREIEDALHRLPGVIEAAAVAMPHPRLGETVCAYLIAAEDAVLSLRHVAAHLEAEGLARQKFPEHIERVDDLPRTASGKIRKDVLRSMIAEKVRHGEVAL
ncbi:MAG: AMP-binding protein [Alkalilacustris sp.]